jgi:hypothetical protein
MRAVLAPVCCVGASVYVFPDALCLGAWMCVCLCVRVCICVCVRAVLAPVCCVGASVYVPPSALCFLDLCVNMCVRMHALCLPLCAVWVPFRTCAICMCVCVGLNLCRTCSPLIICCDHLVFSSPTLQLYNNCEVNNCEVYNNCEGTCILHASYSNRPPFVLLFLNRKPRRRWKPLAT